jgi:hypothetical protein
MCARATLRELRRLAVEIEVTGARKKEYTFTPVLVSSQELRDEAAGRRETILRAEEKGKRLQKSIAQSKAAAEPKDKTIGRQDVPRLTHEIFGWMQYVRFPWQGAGKKRSRSQERPAISAA